MDLKRPSAETTLDIGELIKSGSSCDFDIIVRRDVWVPTSANRYEIQAF